MPKRTDLPQRTDLETTIAEHVVNTAFEDLPPEVIAVAKSRILDTIGVMLAGTSAAGCSLIADALRDWGGRPESTVVGTGDRLPADHVAQIHSSYGHAFDFDDNDDRNATKVSVIVVPVTLALAERQGVSGRDALVATVLGIDLGVRIGLAINPRRSPSSRHDGYFAGAAAGAKVLGADADGVANALGIAYSQLATAGMTMIAPSLTKRLVPGQIARDATWAAILGRKGFPTGRELLHGKGGYYEHFRRSEGDLDRLTEDLGKVFEVQSCVKPYPSGRFIHHAIDGALALRAEHGFEGRDVDRVVVRFGSAAMQAVGGGIDGADLDQRRRPHAVVDALFSAPYNVATALVNGTVTLDNFTDEAISRPETLDLAGRVTPMLDATLDDWEDFITPAVVEVDLRDGRTLSTRIDYAKGNWRRPCSDEELMDKFWSCVDHAAMPIPRDQVEHGVAMLADLENVTDLAELMATFTAGTP